MARVFISHSSVDNATAGDLKTWLDGIGFETPFLDFDHDSGIPPGAEWEQTLYEELERSEAVIIVLTANWMKSKWCFAEFVQARALGKPIYPIIEAPAGERLVAPDIQHLDLLVDRRGGLERLKRELERIATDIRRGYRFPRGRSPYPGLAAFEEEDAAVYFGRDEEIRHLTEILREQRAHSNANILAILGASGSGKSSLLRAGLLPCLKQEAPSWTVLPICRFTDRPLDSIALVFTLALGDGADLAALHRRLINEPDAALSDLEVRLKAKAGVTETKIVLPIDQFEELLTLSSLTDAAPVWHLLKLLSERRSAFAVVLTLRSDYLDRVQNAAARGFGIVPFPLDPLSADRLPDIIQKPGRVVNLRIEDTFVQAALHDAGSGFALPLLAFALREIYEARGRGGHWTLADYEALRDPATKLNPIENALRQAAERVMAQARQRGEDIGLLRRVFIPRLVRVNEEGRYVKQPAARTEIDPRGSVFIDDLIAARLLSVWTEGGVQRIEAAHEALFTAWPTLRVILDEDREFLIAREQLKRDVKDWLDAAEGDKSSALLTGLKLQRARGWLIDRARQLAEDERRFLAASVAVFNSRERAARLRRNSLIASLVFIAGGFAVATYVFSTLRQQAEAERSRAEAALLTNVSTTARVANHIGAAAGLAARALAAFDTTEARSALLQALIVTSGNELLSRSTGGLSPLEIVVDPGGSEVLLATGDGSLASWRLADGKNGPLTRFTLGPLYDPRTNRSGPVALAVDKDGGRTIVGSDGSITRANSKNAETSHFPLRGVDHIFAAAVAASAGLIVVVPESARFPLLFDDKGASLALSWGECEEHVPQGSFVSAIGLDNSATTLVVGYGDGWVCAVKLRQQETHAVQLGKEGVAAIVVAPASGRIAMRMEDGNIVLASGELGRQQVIQTSAGGNKAVAWAPNSEIVAAECAQGTICVWRIDGQDGHVDQSTKIAQFGTGTGTVSLAWLPDNERIVSVDFDGLLKLWSIKRLPSAAFARTIKEFEPLTSIDVSSDGEQIAIGTATSTAIVWNIITDQVNTIDEIARCSDSRGIAALTWNPSTPRLAAATDGGQLCIIDWPAQRTAYIQRFADRGQLTALQWLPDGVTLAIGATDGKIGLWKPGFVGSAALSMLEPGRPGATQLPASDIQALVFDRPRNRLLTTGQDGRVRAWSLTDPGMVSVFEEARSSNPQKQARSVLTLLPDGSHLLVTGNDGELIVYDLASGRVEKRVNAGGEQIDAAALSSNGKALVTLRPDGRVDLWDVAEVVQGSIRLTASLSLLVTARSLLVAPRAVSFLPHENQFAVATASGTLLVFSPDPDAWRSRAETLAPQ
jgi:WD40 repeat protein